MFSIRGLFKRKQAPPVQAVMPNPSMYYSQEQVFKAVEAIGHPCNGRTIAKFMKTDSACVTPRLAELVKKGRLRVAYVKVGLDKKRRNFYVVASK